MGEFDAPELDIFPGRPIWTIQLQGLVGGGGVGPLQLTYSTRNLQEKHQHNELPDLRAS